jgi:lathosterol oxidase
VVGVANRFIHVFLFASSKTFLFYFLASALFGLILPHFRLKSFSESKRLLSRRAAILSFFAILVFGCGAALRWITIWLWSFPRPVGFPAAFGPDNAFLWGLSQILWIILVLFILDFTFYWSHRAMHSRALYNLVHSTHHRFIEPSAFASYAMNSMEAAFLASTMIFVPYLIVPYNTSVADISAFIHVSWAGFIHSGFESSGWSRRPLLRYIYSPSHHYIHHRRGVGNYGIYFTFWDKLMGTEDTDFVNLVSPQGASEPILRTLAEIREST